MNGEKMDKKMGRTFVNNNELEDLQYYTMRLKKKGKISSNHKLLIINLLKVYIQTLTIKYGDESNLNNTINK